MKVTVTHLKAPWPQGTAVGHVIQFEAGRVPDWAVNKCMPAPDDAEPAAVVPSFRTAIEPAAPAGAGGDDLQAAQALKAAAEQATAEALQMLDASKADAEALRAQLAEKDAALQAATAELEQLRAKKPKA